jgi:hypothetical protein
LKLRAEFIEDVAQRAKAIADLNEMESMIAGFLTFAKDDSSVEPTATIDLGSMLRSASAPISTATATVSNDSSTGLSNAVG